MPLPLRGLTIGLALFVTSVAYAQAPTSAIDTQHRQAASPAIQAFVRQAIADRFAARDIPDFGMLSESGEILIRQETGNPNSDLTFEAVPQTNDRPFLLIQQSVAQARADATATSIVFITVGRVVVNGPDATINLGVDTVDPRSPGTIKLCCCSGDAKYHRVGDEWKFVRWESQVCS
jgi:hypothetical protein